MTRRYNVHGAYIEEFRDRAHKAPEPWTHAELLAQAQAIREALPGPFPEMPSIYDTEGRAQWMRQWGPR